MFSQKICNRSCCTGFRTKRSTTAMAFWTHAGSSSGSLHHTNNHRPSAPAHPLTYVMRAGPGSLADYATLVRLRVDVPAAAADLSTAAEEATDDETAAEHAHIASTAVGKLHKVIIGIEGHSADAYSWSVLELLQDKSLHLLCSKTVVAKMYKSLLQHQTTCGYTMAAAKACLSQKPVAAWDLAEALQTAVLKTLTGSSSGIDATDTHKTAEAAPAPAGGEGAVQQQHVWMCLSRHKLVGANLLFAVPGQQATAVFADLAVRFDGSNKAMLLMIKGAGNYRFRLFSPMQLLSQDASALHPLLSTTDTDQQLLSDPVKLAAAGRQLDGRAVKLLPDERLAFIKGLTPAPKDQQQLEQLSQFWLGSYGLLLPAFPFLVGVSSHPEAEAAELQVPSCCVLTNLGLSALPGSQPGGSCFAEAVRRLLADLQRRATQFGFWGHSLTVELRDNGAQAGAGVTEANLQVATQGSQPVTTAAEAESGAGQLKSYSLQAQWSTATDLHKLQAQSKTEAAAAASTSHSKAGANNQQSSAVKGSCTQQQQLSVSAAQLLGLVETDDMHIAAGGASQQAASQQQQQQGVGTRLLNNREQWQGLCQYLSKRELDQQQQQLCRPPAAVSSAGLKVSSSLAGASSAGNHSSKAVGAAAVAPKGAAGGGGGGGSKLPAAAPRFQSRKPGAHGKPPKAQPVAKPAAAAAAAKRKMAAAAAPSGSLLAAVAAAAAGGGEGGDKVSKAAAAVGGSGSLQAHVNAKPAVAKLPSLGKRPAAADEAGAKQPAAKKPKAAAASKKTAAAAVDDTAKESRATIAPAAGDGAPTTPQDPAAATAATAAGQQQQRKRTKASDLDLAAVSNKVQAAFASSGSSLKGVSVPEMQCYLRAQGVKGGSAKRADVEARLLVLLAANTQGAAATPTTMS